MKLRHVVQILRDYREMFPTLLPVAVGSGWHGILDELFRDLKAIEADADVNFRIQKIGREGGLLVVYLDTPEVHTGALVGGRQLVNAARRETEHVCEQCGLDAVMRVRAQRVRCDECERFSRYRGEIEAEHFAAIRRMTINYIRASLIAGVLITPEKMFADGLSHLPPDESRVIFEAIDDSLGYIFTDGWADGISAEEMKTFRVLEFVDAV